MSVNLNRYRSLPEVTEYHLTNKSVTGGSKKEIPEFQDLLRAFFGHYSQFVKVGNDYVLDVEAKDLTNPPRGKGTHVRIDIQGREGNNAVRIAYQIGSKVIAQIIVPVKTRISEEKFEEALIESLIKKVVVSFLEENVELETEQATKVKKKK